MWSITAIKERARERKETNRWRMILAAFVLTLVLGTNVSANFVLTWMTDTGAGDVPPQEYAYDEELMYDQAPGYGEPPSFMTPQDSLVMAGFVLIVFLVALPLILAVLLPVNIFLLNPFSVGGRRFFYQNIREDAQARELCYTFDYGYKNSVKTLFFRDLYLFLWTLLFVVPGIVKSYEYRMIPYLLGEYPQLSKEEAFSASKEMMTGNKWKAFLFDLSFIGWRILNIFTFGMLGIFYVDPYYHQADAMLYDAIKYESGRGSQA